MDKYFNRKIYDRIKKWKDDDSSRYALLIEGARRVGLSIILMYVLRLIIFTLHLKKEQQPSLPVNPKQEQQ